MPATAAMMEPEEVVLSKDEVTLVMAKEVVVELTRRELPSSVVEPSKFELTELNAPATVEDAETESAEVVAPPLRERLRPEMAPVLEMEKRVVVANEEVDEAIRKSVVGERVAPPVMVALAKSERSANGEDVPMPTLPERNEILPLEEVAANQGPTGAFVRIVQFLSRFALEVIGAR